MTRLIVILILLPLGALAGDNTGARFVPLGKPSVAGVGPGQEVGLGVQASGLVAVKHLEVLLEVSNPVHFDVSSAKITLGEGFEDVEILQAPKLLERDGRRVRFGVAVVAPGQIDGQATFAFTLKTSDTFTADTHASLSLVLVSVGPSLSERDEFRRGGALDVRLEVNGLVPPDVATSLRPASWGQVKLAGWER